MRADEDAPWHSAKKQIAEAVEDLTILPRVNAEKRNAAVAAGLSKWTDPGCTAARLGIKGEKLMPLVDAVIRANHSPLTGPRVFPDRITIDPAIWRTPALAEFFVDFETVSDLDDDFSRFPEKGGQPLIFMVGCGSVRPDGTCRTEVFTADRLDEAQEKRVIDSWLDHMRASCAERGISLESARLFHWSPAEVSFIENAYNSAAERHGLPRWKDLPWCDLLATLVRAQPVTVRGAFGFGLKAVTKAMSVAGLIGTQWPDGVADGLGAMVGAWTCDREVRGTARSMRDLDLMKEIEAYNRIDVEAMRDVLGWLRANR
jgi:hypothetical protein